MKIAVIGATARTGMCVIKQALDREFDVTAIMRNSTNFAIQHDNLKIIEGDLFSEEFLTEQLKGCDAVMSCIGARTYSTTLYSDSIKVIISAMRKAGVKRLVNITSWCTSDNPRDRGPFVLEWILKPTILKKALADMALMEKYLDAECSDIKYTVVRPPELSKRPSTGKTIKVEVERLFVPGATNIISREDLASFMLSCLETNDYNGKMVSIGV